MRETKALPKELFEPLNEARKALKLSQTEIAKRAGLPQATVSNCLQGKTIQRESILAVLNAFTAVLGEQRTMGGLSDENAADFGQAIQRAYTHCSVGDGTFRAHPGGGMPPKAVNRLPRPALWREMEETLQDHPFSMVVDGPLQSGKTTLLLQLVEAARKEEFSVALFDCIIVPEGEPSSVLFSGLARTLASEWGLELATPPPNDTFSFTQWLLAKRRAQPEPRCLLILDQVTDLEMSLITDLESVIRGLHNQRGWLNISFVVARCPRSIACEEWMLKSRGYFNPHVEVGWFDEEEVHQLVTLHPDCPQPELVAARLYDEFEGQPYLTHASIAQLEKVSNSAQPLEHLLDKLIQEALHFEGPFGWFCGEVKRAVWGSNVVKQRESLDLERAHLGRLLNKPGPPKATFYQNLADRLLGGVLHETSS